MQAAIQLLGHIYLVKLLVPLAIAVAVSAAPAAAPALPSAAATAPLFRSIAALAINRAIAPGFKGHCRGLSTTGAHHRGAGAHATTPPAVLLRAGRCIPAPSASAPALFRLPAGFAAARRGVAAFLEKLLLTCGKNKFLTAVATRQ
jgi:hypothetical protein